MSRKRTTYTADFKTKLVLEVLDGTKTLNEIATQCITVELSDKAINSVKVWLTI